jgi:hypothetical protein
MDCWLSVLLHLSNHRGVSQETIHSLVFHALLAMALRLCDRPADGSLIIIPSIDVPNCFRGDLSAPTDSTHENTLEFAVLVVAKAILMGNPL